jgi:hypothetical protein
MVWECDSWIWFGTALWYCVILYALCVICDPLCLCDHTLIKLIWVAFACNFNLVNRC